MTQPRDFKKALRRYDTFHQLEPKHVGTFRAGFNMPAIVVDAGDALWSTYRSDKWEGKFENYIHDHDAGVRIGLVDRPDNVTCGKVLSVPLYIRNTATLVLLGDSLGYAYEDHAGEEVEAQFSRSAGVELYCTPNGRALVVVVGKARVEAVLWGGGLDVTSRGIVG